MPSCKPSAGWEDNIAGAEKQCKRHESKGQQIQAFQSSHFTIPTTMGFGTPSVPRQFRHAGAKTPCSKKSLHLKGIAKYRRGNCRLMRRTNADTINRLTNRPPISEMKKGQSGTPDWPFQEAKPNQACLTSQPVTSASALPMSASERTVLTPASCSAANFSSAVPLPPEIIAPAWPIRLPAGAVTPAI